MRVVGVIAEYDPFHRGHARQLVEAKRLAGADRVVVVMSGCFTQRGAVFALRSNLEKLRKRYSQRFSAEGSMRRT